MSESRMESKSEIETKKVKEVKQVRRFADPGPVCCCALAASNFIAGAYNLQCGGITNCTLLVATAALYGGFTQFLGGMWLFANDNVDATIVTSYGAFWVSWAFINAPNSGILAAYDGHPVELQTCLGFYNLAWTIFTFGKPERVLFQ
ncbi:hypothetical protein HDU98_012334 [Podochytrium sp. JEL0797]|nr:hypothetical protein HDU98_012334 [Podochytrium sp. JEL0797]